jgi:hypothetical protein
MAKRPAKEPRWRISRIKSTPAAEYGTVSAPDAERAIKKAIEEWQIEKRYWPLQESHAQRHRIVEQAKLGEFV